MSTGSRIAMLDIDEAKRRAAARGIPDTMAELSVFRIALHQPGVAAGLIGGAALRFDRIVAVLASPARLTREAATAFGLTTSRRHCQGSEQEHRPEPAPIFLLSAS